MRRSLLVLVALAVSVLFGLGQRSTPASALSPGTTWAPLLTCPNTDGSSDGSVGLAGDILGVAFRYQKAPPDPAYHILYDRNADNYIDLANDILGTAARYQEICPLVDTQVAQATQWALANAPRTEDVAALAAIGYTRAGPDVPGQGVHYINWTNWADPAFSILAPEGLVYADGLLAAQLYVSQGSSIGWVGEDPILGGPCNDGIDNNDADSLADAADPQCQIPANPTGSPPDDVDIDMFCNPGPCSWSGGEGWHLHYHLCMYHLGQANANLTLAVDDAACAGINNAGCLPSGCGTYLYSPRVGWMGHLWNHLPNKNTVPDYPDYTEPSTTRNGRFADCYPDGGVWKPYDCPQ